MYGEKSTDKKRQTEESSCKLPEKKVKMSIAVKKTPITILQEMCAKINPKDMPVYTELKETPAEYVNHNLRFFIKCNAFGISCIGGGVTKKIAKHDAAERLLMKHQYAQSNLDMDFDDDSQALRESNNTSDLLDFCTLRNFHKPEFICIDSYGPSHDPSFIFECRLDSIRRTATAGSKQEAKQMSAKAVLKILRTSFPNLEKKLAVVNDTNAITETIREKIKSYLELKKKDKIHTMGRTSRLKDRHNFFKTHDEDFFNDLKRILISTETSDEEKYKNLVKELRTMWPVIDDKKFIDTDLMQFEILIDYEVFTCVIIATKENLQKEVLEYFYDILGLKDHDKPSGDVYTPQEIVFHPL